MDLKKFVSISMALGNENRVKIINLLSSKNLCSCQILEYFHISQPTLSAHMKILKNAGLVIEYPSGKWKNYELNKKTLDEFILGCKDIANKKPLDIKECKECNKE